MKKRNPSEYLLYGIPLILGGTAGIKYLGRSIANRLFDQATKTFMTDQYDKNLWEFVSASSRVGLQNIEEINLRSELGKVIDRPLGSPKKFPSINDLMFSFAQIDPLPVPDDTRIDISVVIGKKAANPLHLQTPIMISGMAYGFALSKKFRIALAKGASMVSAAVNTGQGGLLPEERKAAKHLILQYNRGDWGNKPEILRQADAVEFHLGQGAVGGTHHHLNPKDVTREMRKHFGVKKGKAIVYKSRIPGINNPQDFIKRVKDVRKIVNGVPIGAKIGASDEIEKDLYWCLEAGLDYVAIGGAEAASKGAPPILLDDFGLPILFALVRAVNYLEKAGARKDLDLIVAGKLINPGDFLKALALGADAVYIGTAALFATAHKQVLKAMPFVPPSQISWIDGQKANKFSVDEGAQSLAKFIKSCNQEMQMGLSSLGKTSIHQVSKDDLIALNPFIAEVTGVRLGHIPPPDNQI